MLGFTMRHIVRQRSTPIICDIERQVPVAGCVAHDARAIGSGQTAHVAPRIAKAHTINPSNKHVTHIVTSLLFIESLLFV